MIFNIGLTLFFVFLNGFFVAAEFAIVKVRASQIEMRIREGSKIAKIVRKMIEHLDAFLSATQLGITLASLGLGWIGESVVSEIIIDIMAFFGLAINPELAHDIALPIAFVTITILHIVFGELAPKSLAIQRSEQVTMVVAIPLRIFYYLFSPFIWVLNNFANFLVKLAGFEPITEEQEMHSPEEIRYLIEESSKIGLLNPYEHKLLENVFEFSETPVRQIMVPRNQMVGIDLTWELDEIIELIVDEGYSRLPVFKGDIDNIIGVIYAKDIISMLRYKEVIVLQDIVRPALFVNEDQMIEKLLKQLQLEKIHLAIVLNEFGGTAGLVTLEDIIEEIVGEIQDEYDEELPIVQPGTEGVYIINAYATVADVNDYLPVELPEDEDYETVGGLINHFAGRIPELGEFIQLDDYNCTIIKRSERSLELVQLELKKPDDNGGEEE